MPSIYIHVHCTRVLSLLAHARSLRSHIYADSCKLTLCSFINSLAYFAAAAAAHFLYFISFADSHISHSVNGLRHVLYLPTIWISFLMRRVHNFAYDRRLDFRRAEVDWNFDFVQLFLEFAAAAAESTTNAKHAHGTEICELMSIWLEYNFPSSIYSPNIKWIASFLPPPLHTHATHCVWPSAQVDIKRRQSDQILW